MTIEHVAVAALAVFVSSAFTLGDQDRFDGISENRGPDRFKIYLGAVSITMGALLRGGAYWCLILAAKELLKAWRA